jgi:hypothetical protein
LQKGDMAQTKILSCAFNQQNLIKHGSYHVLLFFF